MNDREAILMAIIRSVAPWNSSAGFEVGDMVVCRTSGIHAFTVGKVVEKLGDTEAVIKELGSKETCHISNEFIHKLVVEPLECLEGAARYVYLVACKTLHLAMYRVQTVTETETHIQLTLIKKYGMEAPLVVLDVPIASTADTIREMLEPYT